MHRHLSLADEAEIARVKHALETDWRRSIYEGVDRLLGVTSESDVPSQVRLSFIPGGMAVSYSTAFPYVAPDAPSVAYGESESMLNLNATTFTTSTYGTLYFHTVLIESLAPNTRYFYRVYLSDTTSSFVTARAAGDETPFTVLVVGDLGLANSANTIKQMQLSQADIDFNIHLGDLSYADDFYLRSNNTYEGSWDAWQDEMEPITANAAYMTLPGNHEVTCTEVTPFLCPHSQRNFTAYRHRFRMPSLESGGVENMWFSYDYGSVHFIHINTETDFPNSPMGPGTWWNGGPFGDQLAWFEADLADAVKQRSNGVTPWIIVCGHRPLYSSKANGTAVINAFESLLIQYKVDVYYSGHVHWYERLWPLNAGGTIAQRNYDNPSVPVYIIEGAGGNVEGHNVGAELDMDAVLDQSDFGYGKMMVANSTHLRWQFFGATDGALLDEVWINKER